MNNVKFFILFLVSGFIISCGFHLRGNQDLSAVLPEVQLQGVNIQTQFGQELLAALIAAKVNVQEASDIILAVTKNEKAKRVLSLDSAGRANQYELSYQLNFSLVKKVKAENEKSKTKEQLVDLMPAQKITAKREYLFDANLLLAKADEESRLNNDMRQAAILQLIRRIMFSLKYKSTTSESK